MADISGLLSYIISIANMNFLVMIILFIAFIFLVKKAMSVIINAVWIVIASALFPIIMNMVFNYNIELSVASIMSFVTLGLGFYSIYLLGKIIYTMLGFMERGGKLLAFPFTSIKKSNKKDKEKKIEEFIKIKEEEEKEEKKKKKDKKKKKKDKKKKGAMEPIPVMDYVELKEQD